MWKKLLAGLVCLILVAAGAITWTGWSLSVPMTAEDEAGIRKSPNFSDESFVNAEPEAEIEITLESLNDEFFGDQQRVPPGDVPVVEMDASIFNGKPEPGLRVTWLGHASTLVEIDGYRVLTDPVFSERASPFASIGPKRFHPTPIPLKQLKNIDAVVISHNHYDHLDKATILHLAAEGARILVPLGNGGLLRSWKIPPNQIVEMDWWQENKLGDLTLVATPARHYSSRGFFDYQKTLWLSWAIVGPRNRAFFSGDSGYAKSFAEIGERYGPFQFSLIKIGAYGPGQYWIDIHMPPEQSVQVHKDVGGEIMLPVHWATFNLARHDWDEPVKRTKSAAEKAGIVLATPKVGETLQYGEAFQSTNWWELVR